MARVATDSSVRPELHLTMTYEEFLASGYSESHAEWVDGEVIVFMPPDQRHADVALFLAILFTLYAQAFHLGRVIAAPFEMRLRPGRSSREPDVLFVNRDHLDRLDGRRLNGAADLVVELVSPSSVARDRADKFYEYQEAGIPEYLVVDPRVGNERVDLYRLGADGKYQPVLPNADGIYHFATLPGFWLDPAWLWQESLPFPLDALAAIAPERFGGVARPAAAGSGT